jgi:hypothetical protein
MSAGALLSAEGAQAYRLLCTLTSHLRLDPNELAEVYLRSAGSSGALVYVSNRQPDEISEAARSVGATEYQLGILAVLLERIRTTRRAFKVGLDRGISLFSAIDFEPSDIKAICDGLTHYGDGDILSSAFGAGGWKPCGMALEFPPFPSQRHRLRVYAMCNGVQLNERLQDSGSHVREVVPCNDPLFHLASPHMQCVLNLAVVEEALSVKVEFPQISLSRVIRYLTGSLEECWGCAVADIQERLLQHDRLNHLGVRWSPVGRELCAYIGPLEKTFASPDLVGCS